MDLKSIIIISGLARAELPKGRLQIRISSSTLSYCILIIEKSSLVGGLIYALPVPNLYRETFNRVPQQVDIAKVVDLYKENNLSKAFINKCSQLAVNQEIMLLYIKPLHYAG